MEKTVRVYYITHVDIPLESDNFTNKGEMLDYAEEIADDLISPQDAFDNLDICDVESEIVDI